MSTAHESSANADALGKRRRTHSVLDIEAIVRDEIQASLKAFRDSTATELALIRSEVRQMVTDACEDLNRNKQDLTTIEQQAHRHLNERMSEVGQQARSDGEDNHHAVSAEAEPSSVDGEASSSPTRPIELWGRNHMGANESTSRAYMLGSTPHPDTPMPEVQFSYLYFTYLKNFLIYYRSLLRAYCGEF